MFGIDISAIPPPHCLLVQLARPASFKFPTAATELWRAFLLRKAALPLGIPLAIDAKTGPPPSNRKTKQNKTKQKSK